MQKQGLAKDSVSKPIRTGRVGVAELTALVTIYCTADVFLSYPSRVAQEGAGAAWMIPLIAGAVALGAFFILYMAVRRFPDENLLQVVSRTLTPLVGIPLTLVFAAFFLLQTAIVMREFTETVVTTVLPSTPAEVIALSFLLVVLYYAYKGLEGLTRVAVFMAYILAIGLIALLVLPLTWFNVHQLLPLMGRGMQSTIVSGLWNTSMFANILMLFILYPAVRNQKQFVRTGVISVSLTAVIIAAVVLVVLGTFADAINGAVSFPLYQLARLIYIGRFVQRLEAMFVFVWTAAAVLKMGFGLWLTAYLYATAFRMPVYRPVLFPLAILLYVLVFLPPDITAVESISGRLLEPYGWTVEIALPLLVAALAILGDRWRRRGKTTKGRGGAGTTSGDNKQAMFKKAKASSAQH